MHKNITNVLDATRFLVLVLIASRAQLCQAQATTNRPAVRNGVAENPSEGKFRSLDQDSDGFLTEAEFTAEGSMPVQKMRRDFRVMDFDGDGRMSRSEFFGLPYWVPDSLRDSSPDAVVLLVEARLKELMKHWTECDQDGNRLLTSAELKGNSLGKEIPGLESTRFEDWDLNDDAQVSLDEAKMLLEIAFGVKTPEGGSLRSKSGQVVDWRLFRQLKQDENGFVDASTYLQALGPLPPQEKANWLQSTDKNLDGKIGFDEFSISNHRTDPISSFLHLDTDLNGKLSRSELEAPAAAQSPLVFCMFPAFDDDNDGSLSLREYQLTPLVNLLVDWQSASDVNGDDRLSIHEFRFHPGIALTALSAEYFRRLDVNKDDALSLDEFNFIGVPSPTLNLKISVMAADGKVTSIPIPNYPIVHSPEISPDGKWVAVDGWKQGESNVAAHLLIVNLDTREVRDLGIGCIPGWSADGRQIAYSRYGEGVFIRDFEGKEANVQQIDRNGWSIRFSPDGLKTAYVSAGNFTIHTLKTNEKRSVFPPANRPYRYIEHNFTWSPDSERLCFKGHRPNGTIDIGIVSVNGDDPKLKVRHDGRNVATDLEWVADGNRVVFPYNSSGNPFMQIYELNPDDDSPAVRYPRQPPYSHNGGMCWSRDGKTFVFMSRR